MSYKPEVQTAGDGDSWTGNNLAFATFAEAESNARNLMGRWMSVTATRVVESDQPVNYRWVEGKGLQAVDATTPPRMPADRVSL